MLGPGDYVVLDDVIYETFGISSGTGAFLVRVVSGTEEVAVTSRIFSRAGDETFGQGFEGIPVEHWVYSSVSEVLGIQHTSRFRTNFYALAGESGATLNVRVATNQTEWASVDIHLGAHEPFLQNIRDFLAFPPNLEDGKLKVRVDSGSAVFGASKVDNHSDGPSTLEAITYFDVDGVPTPTFTPTRTPTPPTTTPTRTRTRTPTPTRTRTPQPSTPTFTPTRTHTPQPPATDVVVQTATGYTYHLEPDTIRFTPQQQAYNTGIWLCRSDGARVYYYWNDFEYIYGPTQLVDWSACCADWPLEKVTAKGKGHPSDEFTFYGGCGSQGADFKLKGTEVGTGLTVVIDGEVLISAVWP